MSDEARDVEAVELDRIPTPGEDDELDAARKVLIADPSVWTEPVTATPAYAGKARVIGFIIIVALVVVPLLALAALREPPARTDDFDAPALLDAYSSWYRTGNGLADADAERIWADAHRHEIGGGAVIAAMRADDGTCWSILVSPNGATNAAVDDPELCGSDTDSTIPRQGASR